jgi:hypothetical protein
MNKGNRVSLKLTIAIILTNTAIVQLVPIIIQMCKTKRLGDQVVKRFVISLVKAADIHHVIMAMMKQIERVRMQLKAVTVKR